MKIFNGFSLGALFAGGMNLLLTGWDEGRIAFDVGALFTISQGIVWVLAATRQENMMHCCSMISCQLELHSIKI